MDRSNWLFIATDEMGPMKPADFVHDKGWPSEAFGLAKNAKEFSQSPLPSTFFIDAEGNLVEKIVGSMHKAEIEEKLKPLL